LSLFGPVGSHRISAQYTSLSTHFHSILPPEPAVNETSKRSTDTHTSHSVALLPEAHVAKPSQTNPHQTKPNQTILITGIGASGKLLLRLFLRGPLIPVVSSAPSLLPPLAEAADAAPDHQQATANNRRDHNLAHLFV
jgi:hypothetical protein